MNRSATMASSAASRTAPSSALNFLTATRRPPMVAECTVPKEPEPNSAPNW